MSTLPLTSPLEAPTHSDPYPYYAKLVRERPVYFDEALAAWVVTGARPVADVLGHAHCKVRPAGESVPPGLLGSQAGVLFSHLVRMNDGARQQVLKEFVAQALDSMNTDTFSVAAREAARQAVALTSPARPGKGLTDYCYQVPAQTLGLLLGLPEEKLAVAARLVSLLVRCISPGGTAEQLVAGREAAGMLWNLFDGLLGEGPREAGSSLLWELHDKSQRRHTSITRDDVIANAIGFMTQAFEATTGLIGNALRALVGAGDPLQTGVADAAEMAAFVREVLRHDSPIQNTRRFATESFELFGQTIDVGDSLLLVLAAANRDPAVCPNPEVFDPYRAPAPLFSFSAARHMCPGQRLAETIAAAAIMQLVQHGVEPSRFEKPVRFRHSLNARVPELMLAA
jgi:cytochrome P450